jgi:hypothetical protein
MHKEIKCRVCPEATHTQMCSLHKTVCQASVPATDWLTIIVQNLLWAIDIYLINKLPTGVNSKDS